MLIIIVIPFLLLIADAFLAHWIVKRFVKFNQPLRYEKLVRFLIALLLFSIFAVTTIYLLAINFRFER